MKPEAQRIAIAEGVKCGRLMVIRKSHQNKQRNWMWLCVCDCGAEKTICESDLSRGHIASCGCLRRDTTRVAKTTHGNARRKNHTPEYRTWRGILTRCLNPKNPAWEYYGHRGITVCERWINSFEDFVADVGPKPSPQHSIDRIDNGGDYEPINCRWATAKEQSNNRSKRRWKKKPSTKP